MTSSTEAATDYIGFRSLAELRSAHGRLVRDQEDDSPPSDFLTDVRIFVERAVSTGELLSSDEDRSAAQSLIDYWCTVLFRSGQSIAETSLARFKSQLGRHLKDEDCPYPGLESFSKQRASFFFGREKLLRSWIDRLNKGRLLVITGPSGRGKSSLLHAGLLVQLLSGAIPGSDQWRYFGPTAPRSEPLAQLARLFPTPKGEEAAWLQSQTERLLKNDHYLLELIADRTPAVLLIDRLEELFTRCDPKERTAFLNNLAAMVESKDVPHRVIVTLRKDVLSPEELMRQLGPLQQYFPACESPVPPLELRELREAIEKPAELIGLRFEPGLVNAMLDDLAGDPAALPLLQLTLGKLWEKRQGAWITWSAYRELGVGRGMLERAAEKLYLGFATDVEREIARALLLQIVRPGPELDLVFSSIRQDEFATGRFPSSQVQSVIDQFVKAGLLKKRGADSDKAYVEVAHEAFVYRWPRLMDWLGAERSRDQARRRLTAAAAQWQESGRAREALWGGPMLEEARQARDLSDLERAFVDVSLGDELRRLGRTKKWLRAGFLAAVFVVVVVSVLAFIAYQQRNAAFAAEQKVQILHRFAFARQLAFAAMLDLETDPERSVLLALGSFEFAYTLEGQDALRQALLASQVRARLNGHTKEVFSAAFSPDGKRVVTASEDGTARVWEADSGKLLLTLEGHKGAVRNANFSPDGKRIVTASHDKTARIWDAETGKELLTLTGHTHYVSSAVFSPDGTQILTASRDGTSIIWDAATGNALRQLPHARDFAGSEPDWVRGASFSPDGKLIATAHSDGAARVWNTATGMLLRTLKGHKNWVWTARFSPDGKRIVTASQDTTARIWDAETGDFIREFKDHSAMVICAIFCGNDRIVTASLDQTARIWEVNTGRELWALRGHADWLRYVDCTPDGLRFVTASRDLTARVWDAPPGREGALIRGAGIGFRTAALSPDGKHITTVSYGETSPRVWDAKTGKELLTLTDHGDDVSSVAFSSDGTQIVSTSHDGTARTWDAASGKLLMTFTGHEGKVLSARFSPDGTRIATVSSDATARLWDAATGQELRKFLGHEKEVCAITFNTDGSKILTGSFDDTAAIWDAVTGKRLQVFSPSQGYRDLVQAVAFAPDGKTIATASFNTCRIWNAETGQELALLRGHRGAIASIAFSPDGKRILTGGEDSAAKLWDAHTGHEILTLRGHSSGIVSVAFSRDGQIMTCGSDGYARIYFGDVNDLFSLASSRVTRQLTQEEKERYWQNAPKKD